METETTPIPATVVAEPVRKCKIENALPSKIIHLAMAAPENPSVRALIFSALKQMPPQEAKTFVEIKDWIETTFNPGIIPKSSRRYDGISIRVSASETEYGRCRYSCQRTAEEDMRITGDEILEAVEEADDFDEVLETIKEKLDDKCSENNFDYESGENDYDDYDSTDTDDFEYNYSRATLHDRLYAWAIANLNNEQKERLGLR